ncbi:MAG TPA: hypothetical protein GX505_06800 [Clostridiales bacterium]|nr:hypothetical protein [Clostridiales bacterium]
MVIFTPYKRITSGIDTQTDAGSREEAVKKAIRKQTGGVPTQDAVEIGNLPGGMWPILEPYTNDNSGGLLSPLPGVPAPKFIWDDLTMEPGETRYFAHAVELTGNPEDTDFVIFIATFADDAHRLFLEEWTPEGEFVFAFNFDGGEVDGNMSPTTFMGELCPPYNWQIIRYFSMDGIYVEQEGNFLVLSYEVVNYNSIGAVNPAGLAYVMDVYKEVETENGNGNGNGDGNGNGNGD